MGTSAPSSTARTLVATYGYDAQVPHYDLPANLAPDAMSVAVHRESSINQPTASRNASLDLHLDYMPHERQEGLLTQQAGLICGHIFA